MTRKNTPPDKLIPSVPTDFEKIAAKFQEDPIKFKRRFMPSPEPHLTRTERNDELEKLYDELGELI